MNRTGLSIALLIATTVGIVFGVWPELDLKLAAPFFDTQLQEFTFSFNHVYLFIRSASSWLIALVALPAVLALAIKLVRPERRLLIPGRAILLMLITLALVPGVLADLVLKAHWGRPRPIDVVEFRGQEHFRPWWDPRGDCPSNCSFIAGEPSGAFWTMSAAAVAPPQWRAIGYVAALMFGTAIGVLRMAAGAHFFTDVVFAGVFAFLGIWIAHGWLYRWRATRICDAAVETALERVLGRAPRTEIK
jgi:lipid A 4'-phosphatase